MAAHVRLRQIARLLTAVLATLAAGTIAFHEIVGESWFQSFYRAVVTVTLTGLDTVPSGNGARVVSIVLVVVGLTIIAYAGAVIVEAVAGGVFTGALAERRRERTIEQLRDHFIICGYGRVGRRVAEELQEAGIRFVVLDFNPDVIAIARAHDIPYVEGRGTEDEHLERAGLSRARGILAA